MATINVPEISTGKLVERVTAFYTGMLKANIPCRDVRPVMLFGPTGVGKSSGVMQIAGRLSKETGREVEVVDIRLTSCTITDLIGIPVPDKDKKGTIWLTPEIYKRETEEAGEPGKRKIFIYFFDELDKASPAIQAAALQLILDRKAWVHSFPEDTFVIAAANPARGTAKYETRMTPELMNRFKHFNVQPDFESFREWGIKEGLHKYVLGYLAFDHGKLYAGNESQDIAFPTPRSWKSVSDLLTIYEGQYDKVRELHYDIAAEIGTAAALEFEGFCDIYRMLPSVEDIFSGKPAALPARTPDVMNAVIASITTYVREHIETISYLELSNAAKFVKAQKFPPDFRTVFFLNLKKLQEGAEAYSKELMKVPEYSDWVKKV